MPMKTLDTTLLAEVTRRLVDEFHPEQIILFGSHAWGIPDEKSDVDVVVIVPESDLSPHLRAARAYRALRGLPIPIEVRVRTHSEFERYRSVPASLEHQISEEGKRLYG
ncbi:MAG: nucleotidyltransferase domain-containing protein [Thermomicrobiales bacterium]